MRSHDFYHCLVENVISTRSVELVSKRFHISIIHISYHHLTTVKQNHKIAILIIRIVRPHRSTTYVDVAYCYRLSSVVCRSVCDNSQPCKNSCTDRVAVWFEGLRTWVGARNHELDGSSDFPIGRPKMRRKEANGEVQGHSAVS